MLRLPPPYEQDWELSRQPRPDAWGHGSAVEARRLGMTWVDESAKVSEQILQVYRIRPADLLERPRP